MLSTLAIASFVHGPGAVGGFGFLFFLIPLFWIVVVGLLIGLVGRRRRHAWAAAGGRFGPWGGGWGGPFGSASRSAEVTLAERFANGDIDEVEYRARLEVLRANAAQPPFIR